MEQSSESRRPTTPPPSYGTIASNEQNTQQPLPVVRRHWLVEKALTIMYAIVASESSGPVTLQYIYCPDVTSHWCTQDWVAILMFRYIDVYSYIHEDFHFDNNNIHGRGCISANDPATDYRRDEQQWLGTRTYFLEDLHQPPRWVARIKLSSLHAETLDNFDLGQLTHDKAVVAPEVCQFRFSLYRFLRLKPESKCNAYYDYIPMEGSWPWPGMSPEERNPNAFADRFWILAICWCLLSGLVYLYLILK